MATKTKEKKYKSWINRPVATGRPIERKVTAENIGHVPIKQKVEEFMLAGKQLELWRQLKYDVQANQKIDESFSDPTRRGDYDLADMTIHQRYLEGVAEMRKEAAEKKAAEIKAKKGAAESFAKAKETANAG